jgi:predicted O-methyltransferase YrrM
MRSKDYPKKINTEILESYNVNINRVKKNLAINGYNYHDLNLSYHYLFCANDFKFKNILELGTGSAEFTYYLSCRFKSSKIISIDNYQNRNEVSADNKINFHKKKKYIKKNITFLKSETNIIKKINKKFDLIFIDADHLFPQVNIDIINSLPLLNKNGFILIDDVVKEKYENKFISDASFELIEYLKKNKLIKVKYLYKRALLPKIVKYIAIIQIN